MFVIAGFRWENTPIRRRCLYSTYLCLGFSGCFRLGRHGSLQLDWQPDVFAKQQHTQQIYLTTQPPRATKSHINSSVKTQYNTLDCRWIGLTLLNVFHLLKVKASSLDIAPLTILNSGALQPLQLFRPRATNRILKTLGAVQLWRLKSFLKSYKH